MGRAKLNMKLIPKEKTRINTFKKRKQGLIRKLHEFKILCDVSACMIIYGPKQETGSVTKPEIWPQDRDEVLRVIGTYMSRNKDSSNKTYGLSDFFNDRKRKIEEELAKLRRKNMEAKYPTWQESMNFMTEPGLRDFAACLRNKAEYVRSRIEILRQNKQGLMDNISMMDYYHYYYNINNNIINDNVHARLLADDHQPYVKQEVLNQMHVPNNIHYPTIDHQNSMMMLLMNGSYNDDHHNNYQPQVYHEPMARYYGPIMPVSMPAPPSTYMWGNNHDGGDQEGDGSQYQMNCDLGRERESTKSETQESEAGSYAENQDYDGDEEAESLINIKDALESLEGQLSSLQALQQQQWYEKEAALTEIEYSQKKLLKELKEYKGKDSEEVINEAIAFASVTEDNSDLLLLPPYPSRPSHPIVSENGYLSTTFSPSTRRTPQNGNRNNNVSDGNRKQSGPWGPFKSAVVFIGTAAKAALTVAGMIAVLSLAGLEPRIRKRDNGFVKIVDLFGMNGGGDKCPPGKVAVTEDGETRCIVKERVEVPFESVVVMPDVSYGFG